jgi:hypothetical protein
MAAMMCGGTWVESSSSGTRHLSGRRSTFAMLLKATGIRGMGDGGTQ